MKQGTNFLLNVRIDYDMDEVEKVEFIFKQDKYLIKKFVYPSDDAFRDGECINLEWDKKDTYLFDVKKKIQMDTRIHIKGSKYNPETEIKTLDMLPTLFQIGD